MAVKGFGQGYTSIYQTLRDYGTLREMLPGENER